MSFLDLMKSIPAPVRAKGMRYHREGRVQALLREGEVVRAIVRGSEEYEIELRRVGKQWTSSCTCPSWSQWAACQHVCAAVLTLIEQEATDDDEDGGDAGEGDAGEEAADFAAEGGQLAQRAELFRRSGAGAPGASRVDARALSALRLAELAQRAFDGTEPRTDRVLRGVLGPPRWPGEPACLRLQVARLGKSEARRTLRFEPVGPTTFRGRFDAVDREALELLNGPAAGPPRWNELQRPLPLAPALQRALLPPLARHGRLAWAEEETDPAQPVRHDADGAWTLAISLRRDGTELVLDATLTRGAERLHASDVQLVLEADLALAGGRLIEVDWRGGRRFFAELGPGLPQRFSAHDQHALLTLLARCPLDLPLDAPELVVEAGGTPTPVLVLPAPEEGRAQLGARIEFEYGGERLARGENSAKVRAGRLVRVRPDRERERAAEAEFVAAGGRLSANARGGTAGAVPSENLRAIVETLGTQGWRVEAEQKPLRFDGTDGMSVKSGIDWFDLEAHFDFEGGRAEMPAILEALAQHTNFVRLDGGGFGVLPEEWLARWGALLSSGKQVGGKLRFARGRAFLLDALLAQRADVDVDAEFARLRERLRGAHEPRPEDAPPGFVGELRHYQRDGLGWLRFLGEAGFGGCLADDMGLGKTVQGLAYVLARRATARTGAKRAQAGERRGPTLVVAPRSLIFNWAAEAARFTPELEVLVHHGPTRARTPAKLAAAELVLTTYGTLRQDAELLAKLEFELVVLDEAQAIKNHAAQAAKAARLLRADLRLALTGTPVENRLADLLSIFEFLNPGLLDGSRALRHLMKGASDEHEVARLAARALRPFLLRRTKEEVLAELPPKTEQVVLCELTGAQHKEYEALREHYRRSVLGKIDELGMERTRMNVLEALLRLRQASCHLGLIDPAREGVPAAKLETLLPLLEEVLEAGHKALVFSQFTSFLALLRKDLDAKKVTYQYLDGRTRDREARVRAFQEDPKSGLFLISLKAGGTGLNLTAADYVFLLDPWWNPAVERQAIDRTHRIGQTRAVTAYRLVAKDTVEEKVLALQDKKRALVDALFEGQGAALSQLTREDLEFLLT